MFEPLAILYVEDDAMSRTIMQLLLVEVMRLEHVTIFADSYNFAERAAALVPTPDIVLLDIHVAPHSGFEMLVMLRALEAYQGARIVALTASVMNEEVQRLREAGFDGVIAKPIDQDTFPDLLARLYRGERLWRIID
jgi:CheY-like chemotaxis protein